MALSIEVFSSLSRRYLLTFFSASLIISATKSPFPKIRSSCSILSREPLKGKTWDHPPKLRINPPPTNSGRTRSRRIVLRKDIQAADGPRCRRIRDVQHCLTLQAIDSLAVQVGGHGEPLSTLLASHGQRHRSGLLPNDEFTPAAACPWSPGRAKSGPCPRSRSG